MKVIFLSAMISARQQVINSLLIFISRTPTRTSMGHCLTDSILNSLWITTNIWQPSLMPTMFWAIIVSITTSPTRQGKLTRSRSLTIMSRRRSKKFPYHLPNSKGSATAVESQGTNRHNVVRRIRNHVRSGLFIRPKSHMQASGNADAASEGSNKSNDTESNQGTSTRKVRWAGVHMKDLQFYQADAIRKCILLDSCSSTMIWSNPDMVSNIRETNKMLNLSTNAGVLSTNKKAYLPRESR